ncbi:MAG: hypothetical protein ACYC6X_00575 [Minisyncoccota bacterium]
MRTALFAGSLSLIANLLILFAFIPFAIGFRTVILIQIAFWTFFATIGATITMSLLRKFMRHPVRPFVALAFLVFFLSLIPIYLHAGILHDFPFALTTTAVKALVMMHVTDSLTISSLVILFVKVGLA